MIIENNTFPEHKLFCNLYRGDLFLLEDDLYMAISSNSAISLSRYEIGTMRALTPKCHVIPVKGYLTITNITDKS